MRKILNLQQIRAERNINKPVIVDQDGVEHVITGVRVKDYLALVDLQESFSKLQTTDGEAPDQTNIIDAVSTLITTVIPNFPVSGLYLDELFEIANMIQESVGGDKKEDAPGGQPQGE